ncbi:MAG: NfeD family protein [Paramuribaculum sp.]|nr:NfeD family protein [Paramuribaculum sp.]MDE6324446.1 NfeD family protein [Paramuribaculum sp.]MDE6488237.1 NfeD family protein [Paramuribaculum sp.]
MELWTIWLIAAGILIIAEILTQMMLALCLAVGAIGALAALGIGLGFEWQVVTMACISLLTYAAALPRFRKWQNRRSDRKCRTGMDALTGRRATVTHSVEPGKTGRARIDGDSWQIEAPGIDHTISAGEEIIVTGYKSIVLTVRPA